MHFVVGSGQKAPGDKGKKAGQAPATFSDFQFSLDARRPVDERISISSNLVSFVEDPEGHSMACRNSVHQSPDRLWF